ncbi:DUF2062 domain-containing protein [uncultured Thalassospira sp.]|jgi:uncharacterized protein (DUF2062 family)|uniref:DUF2062 domain-containing protein n=1 Tax=uncultured Thalassospira sp. TaxID=404382 RepID=UPI0030DBC6B4|tara:strand:- start:8865 stop:9566 length:702 start_codon:yes stop_codon:yes gene_type:complete
MFQRRIKPSSFERIRSFLWPRAGWRRSSRYFAHRVARLPGTPYSIAAGFAIGAAVSFTPFIGFHFVLSALLSFILRANLVASLLGTIVGNPWTFPFIWLWLYHSGLWILGSDPSIQGVHFNMAVLWDFTVEGISYIGRGLIFGIWDGTKQADLSHLWASIVDIIWPMIVGCIPTFVAVWLLFYFPVYRAVVMYRHKRILRRMKVHEKRALTPVLETAKRTLRSDNAQQQDNLK